MTSRRRVLAALALIGALTTVAACGDDGGATATDTSPTAEQTSQTPEPTPSAPTAEPEPGSLPDFAYQDYAYTLQMKCFCANIDQKYRIRVTGGEVSDVSWATSGDGHEAGEAVADDYVRVSIQDLIDRGNDPKAAHVDVEWPAGQAWPDSIYIDQDKTVADEEVTWVISEVDLA
jgi:hypothetical protein